MGRKFIRVALGGVRDEADIRGHRRTYIGSMPGRIIAELRKAGTRNPVMMLDEIDKLGADFRGDPASALLEVLDPAQNHTFTDHYLDVPFDLSQGPVHRHRQHDGHRARPAARPHGSDRNPRLHQHATSSTSPSSYLVPRQLEANGLTDKHVKFKDDALREIIESYTREAGVRNLERNIGSVARAIAAEIVGGKTDKVTVDRDVRHQSPRPAALRARTRAAHQRPRRRHRAWPTRPSAARSSSSKPRRMPGKGAITLTGQIGDVMKESATAAFSLHPLARRTTRHRSQAARRERHPHSRPRRRRSQGRPQRRRGDVHRAGVAAAQSPGAITTSP